MLAGGRGAVSLCESWDVGGLRSCEADTPPPPRRVCLPLRTVELGQALGPQVCYEEVRSRGLRDAEPLWLPAEEICSLLNKLALQVKL